MQNIEYLLYIQIQYKQYILYNCLILRFGAFQEENLFYKY